jgi:hypothetical protein
MELETKHSLQSMLKELYAWCHMTGLPVSMITIIKWELEARSIYKSGLFFWTKKSAKKCKKFLIAFYGHRCP